MDELRRVDVLVVGAGPAGLATAIQLKRRLRAAGRAESVAVIDKAPKLGYHCLSGALFETDCLERLIPEWKDDPSEFVARMLQQRVERDALYFLTRKRQLLVPRALLPGGMKHRGDSIISVSKLAAWLGQVAESLGVEIYTGFSAHGILIDGTAVRGIVLGEKGLDSEGRRKSNYMPPETIQARLTVFADGAQGPLSTKLIETLGLDKGRNPQVFSLGIKQLIRLPPGNSFGEKRSLSTLGYPLRHDVFGGGFLYDLGDGLLSIGLVIGLDWRYSDLDPQRELELLKSHPFIAGLLEGGSVVAAGVKIIPEGGYYSMPRAYADGALLVGDAAGLLDMSKLKGLHLAILSGVAAGETAYEALTAGDFSASTLRAYERRLHETGVMAELRKARNIRQVFTTPAGLFLGAPLSFVQRFIPWQMRLKPDHEAMTRAKLKRHAAPADHKQFVALSGAMHDETLRPHITITSTALCAECASRYGCPCQSFCPAGVYSLKGDVVDCLDPGISPDTPVILLSAADCMHCRTCVVKCPYNNIAWQAPVGGQGPRYRQM